MLFGKRKRIVNKILIVEDEPLTAFDNENLIGDAGYEVVATLDRFADAVETLDREQVDLILCDVRLTGERTGIDLAQVAKNRGIPVLFVTGAAPDNASELVDRLPDEALQRPDAEGRADGGRQISGRQEGQAAQGADAVTQRRRSRALLRSCGGSRRFRVPACRE